MPGPVPDAYLEVRIGLPNELVDATCDFIIENLAGGVVLENEEGTGETAIIFYVPQGQPGYRSRLMQFFERQVSDRLSRVPEIRERRVAGAEWLEQYRATVKLIRITDDVIVRPAWIAPTADKFQLVLEPKMAFGTGSHATTRSCLKVIRERFRAGRRFLDMGCGSGILSILADQMGAAYIKAIDYDLAAVANCRENFAINRVQAPHEVLVGSIEKCSGDAPYEFICTNIIRSTILTMLDRLLRLTAPDGVLVLSGLLEQDEGAISSALGEHQLPDFTVLRDEEWLTYIVSKR